jgi:hypothetical protein
MNHEQINQAKEVLRKAGYHVDSLWHVQDVTDRYECDEETAYDILTNALDRSIERTFDTIFDEAMSNEIKEKKQ